MRHVLCLYASPQEAKAKQEAAKKSKELAQTQKFAKQVLDMLSMPMVSFEAEVCKKIAAGDVADEYLTATNEILVNKVKKMITQATASLVSGEPLDFQLPQVKIVTSEMTNRVRTS